MSREIDRLLDFADHLEVAIARHNTMINLCRVVIAFQLLTLVPVLSVFAWLHCEFASVFYVLANAAVFGCMVAQCRSLSAFRNTDRRMQLYVVDVLREVNISGDEGLTELQKFEYKARLSRFGIGTGKP